jgi:hypothetical protein
MKNNHKQIIPIIGIAIIMLSITALAWLTSTAQNKAAAYTTTCDLDDTDCLDAFSQLALSLAADEEHVYLPIIRGEVMGPPYLPTASPVPPTQTAVVITGEPPPTIIVTEIVTVTQEVTPPPTIIVTEIVTVTQVVTPTPTNTPTNTATSTPTFTPTNTATPWPGNTWTPIPPTATNTPTPEPWNTWTPTPTETATTIP